MNSSSRRAVERIWKSAAFGSAPPIVPWPQALGILHGAPRDAVTREELARDRERALQPAARNSTGWAPAGSFTTRYGVRVWASVPAAA